MGKNKKTHLPVRGDVGASHVVVGVDHVVLDSQEDVFLVLRGAAGRELDVGVRYEWVRADFPRSRVRGRLCAEWWRRQQTKTKERMYVPCTRYFWLTARQAFFDFIHECVKRTEREEAGERYDCPLSNE